MMRSFRLFGCLAGLVVVIGPAALSIDAAQPVGQKIEWHRDLFKAHRASVASKKPMLLVFSADWCGYCRKLEHDTLSDPRMVKYLKAEFTPVQLDLDQDKRIAKILEVESVPCTVVLSPEADLLGRMVGYVDVADYHRALEKARLLQRQIQRVSKQR